MRISVKFNMHKFFEHKIYTVVSKKIVSSKIFTFLNLNYNLYVSFNKEHPLT